MTGAWDRIGQRATRLLAGLILFGLALAMLVKARLGLNPWTAFGQGVSLRTGLTIGTVTVITSLLVLMAWIPLRQRPGLGTIANALVVGPVLDLGVKYMPTPDRLAPRIGLMAASIVASAIATGLYVGAGWGPGPRDGLMTGLAARGVPIGVARASIELTVLAAGWLLGGAIGVGTAIFAVTIGPLVARTLPRLTLLPTGSRQPEPLVTRARPR